MFSETFLIYILYYFNLGKSEILLIKFIKKHSFDDFCGLFNVTCIYISKNYLNYALCQYEFLKIFCYQYIFFSNSLRSIRNYVVCLGQELSWLAF